MRPRRFGRIQFCLRRDASSGRGIVALSMGMVNDIALLPPERCLAADLEKAKSVPFDFELQR
jgi:hypothetical protein